MSTDRMVKHSAFDLAFIDRYWNMAECSPQQKQSNRQKPSYTAAKRIFFSAKPSNTALGR